MAALQEQHPDWIMQAIGGGSGNQETGELAGPIEGYTFYDPKKTEAGKDTFKRYDASGKLLGEQKFKEPGNAWDMTKQFVADVGPLLQFVPTLAPFVRAIGALSAAEQGNILGALASGLPLADKIPGLDKATVTALQNAGKYASVASAAQSKDPMQLLNALSQTKEFGGKVPSELKTIGDYASKAGALQRASKGDIGALFGLAKGVTAPGKSYFPGYDEPSTGEEGFFDVGGEGYVEPEAGDLPAWALDPYKTDTPTFTPSSDDVYEDIENLLLRYENEGFSSAPTGNVNQTVDVTAQLPGLNEEVTLEDLLPGTGRSTDTAPRTVMVSEDKPATVEIVGKRDTTPDYTEDLWPPIDPKSIRDVGDVTKITPGEKLDGTDITEPDLSKDLPTVVGGTKTTGTKTTAKPGMSTEDLMRLLLAMQGQRPEQEEDYRLFAGQPLGYELMYGLRG